MKKNPEIKEYFNLLCNNNYPEFINKYLATKEMQRLDQIGQFCGSDYNNFYNIKYWYTRYDHSIATALITWNFTKDKAQTLAALFHDIGTPAFSHCIDYLMGDSVNQESSEKNVADIINNSEEILKMLREDNINIEEVIDVKKYPIVENDSPRLCADRLEGVLHTVLVWLNTWTLKKIEKVYKNITILNNEDNLPELGFSDMSSGEKFSEAVYKYGIALQQNKAKYKMQYISDALNMLIEKNAIDINSLYSISEEEIIKLFEKNIDSWEIYKNSSKIIGSNNEPKNNYYVSKQEKKRYVIPLIKYNDENIRVDEVSSAAKEINKKYKKFIDKKYCYVRKIKVISL